MNPAMRHGGRVLVDQLRRHGVEAIFTVPGESFLAVLDALHDEPAIRTVVCRHESGAGIMAEAQARLRGDLGVAFVTRGPGATHASVAVHNASMSGTALLLFIGQVPTAHRGRGAFQEVDFEAFFAPLAKWAVEVDRPELLSETAAEAARVAREGRPGPVVVSLPEDVLAEEVAVADAPVASPPQRPLPSPEELADLVALLRTASRPLVLVGGGTWSESAGHVLAAWAERNRLPVAPTFRRQDYIDNDSPSYVGYAGVGTTPALANRIREADLIVAIGTRLGDTATGGYTLLEPPVPRQTLVHIHPDPAELGSVYRPHLSVHAGAPETVAALADLEGLDVTPWQDWAAAARAEYEESLRRRPAPGPVDFGEVMAHLDRACHPRRSSPTVRATSRCGRSATTGSSGTARSWDPRAAPWATPSPPPWRPSCTPRRPRWWPSAATATSS